MNNVVVEQAVGSADCKSAVFDLVGSIPIGHTNRAKDARIKKRRKPKRFSASFLDNSVLYLSRGESCVIRQLPRQQGQLCCRLEFPPVMFLRAVCVTNLLQSAPHTFRVRSKSGDCVCLKSRRIPFDSELAHYFVEYLYY